MYRRVSLLFCLVAALAASSLAQNNYQLNASLTGDNGLTPSRAASGKAAAVGASVVVNTAAVERTAFEVINQKRVDNGLKPLAWSNELASIARLHSRNMAEQKFFDHRSPDNKVVSDRADDAGFTRWRAIGENIAFNRGFQDPIANAVELWLDSSAHRQNLMNPTWNETAVGVAVGPNGSYYFTQVFWFR